MPALEDRRPVAALTTASDHPAVIGEDLAYLLAGYPDLELASVRLIPNDDGTVGIAGRIGQLAGVECPQCHQPAGRPHTEYCPLAIREEVFAGPSTPSLADQVLHRVLGGGWHPSTACTIATCGATPDDAHRDATACTCPPHIDGTGRDKWPDCPVHSPETRGTPVATGTPCSTCGMVDDHKGGCPESGTARQPGAPG